MFLQVKVTETMTSTVQAGYDATPALSLSDILPSTVMAYVAPGAAAAAADGDGEGALFNNTGTAAGTAAAKKDLDLVYVTENLISMAFPCDPRDPTRRSKVPDSNDLNLVSEHLSQKHSGHFMIWNVSEESYDYSKSEAFFSLFISSVVFSCHFLSFRIPVESCLALHLLYK